MINSKLINNQKEEDEIENVELKLNEHIKDNKEEENTNKIKNNKKENNNNEDYIIQNL